MRARIAGANRSSKRSSLQRKNYLFIFLFLLPQLVMYLVFTIWPIIASYYYSLFQWNGAGWPHDFVGVANYIEVMTSTYFWISFKNSFIYTIATILIVVPGSLIIALILNRKTLRGKVFFRTVMFLPVVLTTAIIGIIMSNLFATNGFINHVLLDLGLISKAIPWLNKGWLAMMILILIGSWKSFGVKMIYWLAGLQSLPGDVYEAARLDGANAFQRFIYITFPLLIPFLIVITILETRESFHVFDLVRTFTNGAPFYATDVVPLYIYDNAFSTAIPRMGFASAAGIVFGVATIIVSLLLGLLARRRVQQRTLD